MLFAWLVCPRMAAACGVMAGQYHAEILSVIFPKEI